MDELVQVSWPEDGVAQILQATGPRNFSTFAANEQLLAALERVRDDGARVVVVGSAVDGHFAGHGWLPDVLDTFMGGTVRLRRLVGEATALRLVLDGRPIDASEALQLGLVHRVVPSGQALGAALEWAGWLAQRPGLEACKRALKGARDMPFQEAQRHEMSVFIDQLNRPDVVARVREAQARYDDGADTHGAFGVPVGT